MRVRVRTLKMEGQNIHYKRYLEMKYRKIMFLVAPNFLVSIIGLYYLFTLLDYLAIILCKIKNLGLYIAAQERKENRKFFMRPVNVKSILVFLSL